jgi:hypothetical protein
LSRIANEGDARNQPVRVHAIETSTPWALSLGDHFAAEPTRRLEVIGNDIERVVVVAHQRRAIGVEPDRLRTSVRKRWWPELTEYLRRKIVLADEGTYLLVRAKELWHVSFELCSALGCRGRSPSSGISIPSFGFDATGDERSLQAFPGVSSRIATKCFCMSGS